MKALGLFWNKTAEQGVVNYWLTTEPPDDITISRDTIIEHSTYFVENQVTANLPNTAHRHNWPKHSHKCTQVEIVA